MVSDLGLHLSYTLSTHQWDKVMAMIGYLAAINLTNMLSLSFWDGLSSPPASVVFGEITVTLAVHLKMSQRLQAPSVGSS